MTKEMISDNGQVKTKETDKSKVRPHVLIGFDSTQVERLTNAMNQLLANYAVHYQKLLNFHWNVKGADFFDIHEQFEQQYNAAKENIDDIAERIRIYGKTPLSSMRDFLENSTIKEAPADLKSAEMVKEVLKDYRVLLEYMTNVLEVALDSGDSGTEDMMKGFIKQVETNHWMWTAFSTEE